MSAEHRPHSIRVVAEALSCNHKWKMNTRAETECEECGTIERWEGGFLIETTHPALRDLEEQLESAYQALKAYQAIFAAWEGRESITLNEEALRQWKSIADSALSFPASEPHGYTPRLYRSGVEIRSVDVVTGEELDPAISPKPCPYCAGKGGRHRAVASRFLGTETQVHDGPWETCSFCGGSGVAAEQSPAREPRA